MSEAEERTFLVGLFGDNSEYCKLLGQALGAPGTSSDIQFYNRLDSQVGHIFTALTPIDYPEKLKPFLQTLILTNIYVLIIDLNVGLNAAIGEILVGMDLFQSLFNKKSLIVLSGINNKTEWKVQDIRKKIESIINLTTIKGTEIIEIKEKEDYESVKKKIVELGLEISVINSTSSPYSKVLIDHAFSVKGIGTVILGIVEKGKINSSQMLELTGNHGTTKKIIIRSIQKHDRNFKEANEGDRVGLALKGNISPDEISRDNILSSQGIFIGENKITAQIFINQFYKPKDGEVIPGDLKEYHGLAELKSTPLKIIEGEKLKPGDSGIVKMRFTKPLYHDGSGLTGILCDLNRFQNKLRIAGYFKQILN